MDSGRPRTSSGIILALLWTTSVPASFITSSGYKVNVYSSYGESNNTENILKRLQQAFDGDISTCFNLTSEELRVDATTLIAARSDPKPLQNDIYVRITGDMSCWGHDSNGMCDQAGTLLLMDYIHPFVPAVTENTYCGPFCGQPLKCDLRAKTITDRHAMPCEYTCKCPKIPNIDCTKIVIMLAAGTCQENRHSVSICEVEVITENQYVTTSANTENPTMYDTNA